MVDPVGLGPSIEDMDSINATEPVPIFGDIQTLNLYAAGMMPDATAEEIGLEEDNLELVSGYIKYQHGIILVTGPTGSGKTTTLYGALQKVNSSQLNVITLEDPIEYKLDGISQIQINEKKGLTFARGLRHLLRQDPDIMMVGEVRDVETARIAIQAALTGHLVYSTLHTNDASSTVTRMLDIGLEPYLVASSLIVIVAQRLVRRVCDECKEEPAPDAVDEEPAAEPDPLIGEAPAARVVEEDPVAEPDPVSEETPASRDVEQDAEDAEGREATPGSRLDINA